MEVNAAAAAILPAVAVRRRRSRRRQEQIRREAIPPRNSFTSITWFLEHRDSFALDKFTGLDAPSFAVVLFQFAPVFREHPLSYDLPI